MNQLFRKSASIASLASKHTRAALILVESFRSSPASIPTEDVKDSVFNGEIRSFSCSEFLVKNGFGLGVRGFHFSAPPLEFRASIASRAEFAAVDDFYDEERPSGKKVGGESDEGLEIANLGISLAIVTALASKGIMKLFPIQDIRTPRMDGISDASRKNSCQDAGKKSRKSGRISLMGFRGRSLNSVDGHDILPIVEPEVLMTKDVQRTESWDRVERERDIHQGIDLATTLERIEKKIVITDPRIPDNPIVNLEF